LSRTIVSICGGSASGKSTLAKRLVERLGPRAAVRIATDDYLRSNPYPSLAEFCRHPLQYDWELLQAALAEPDGTCLTAPNYDFVHFARISMQGSRSFILRPIVVLDAMIPYPQSHLTILLRCPAQERRRRLIERDRRWQTQVIDFWELHQLTLADLLQSEPRFDLEIDGLQPIETNLERVLALLPPAGSS